MGKLAAVLVALGLALAGLGGAVAHQMNASTQVREHSHAHVTVSRHHVSSKPETAHGTNQNDMGKSGTQGTHGAAVSAAAHSCPRGKGHGQCVSAVARNNHGAEASKAAANNHGAAVSKAAHSCPAGKGHGQCVSAVARGHGNGSSNGQGNHGAAVSAAAHSCPKGKGHGQCVSAVARGNGNAKGNDEGKDDSGD